MLEKNDVSTEVPRCDFDSSANSVGTEHRWYRFPSWEDGGTNCHWHWRVWCDSSLIALPKCTKAMDMQIHGSLAPRYREYQEQLRFHRQPGKLNKLHRLLDEVSSLVWCEFFSPHVVVQIETGFETASWGSLLSVFAKGGALAAIWKPKWGPDKELAVFYFTCLTGHSAIVAFRMADNLMRPNSR